MKSRAAGAASLAVAFLGAWAPALLAGSVSGRLLDSEGRPVAGARVVWTRFQTDEERLLDRTEGREPEIVGEVRSDASGAFRVLLEKPGLEVALRIEAAGFPAARLDGPYVSEETSTLDDVRFPATTKRKGRVTDEKGAPVAGARVEVRAAEDRGGEAVFVAAARTGADGSWESAAAPADGRALRVRAAGFAPFEREAFRRDQAETTVLRRGGTLEGTVQDAAGEPLAGAVVAAEDVAARTDAAGAFRMTGVPAGLRAVETFRGDQAARATARVAAGGSTRIALRLRRAAAIAGTVVDETTRRPIAGARILVREGGRFEAVSASARRARTDGRGRFRAPGLLPGRYGVSAAGEGYLETELPGIAASLAGGPPLAIALRREAAIAGTVVDEEGKPVPAARVTIPREFGSRRGRRALLRSGFRTRGTATGPDGKFSVRGLDAEPGLTVEASKTGYAAARRTGLRTKSGETVKGVTLVLRRGIAAAGRVVDAENRGIAGVEIRATRTERGTRRFMIFRGGGQEEKPDAVSDAAGDFVLGALEEGRYQVAASREDFAQKGPAILEVVRGGENRVPTIVLERGVGLAGVVQTADGQPVPGARIFAGGGGRPTEATSDGSGRFQIGGLPSGQSVMLFVNAEGYGPRQRNATPPAADLVIVLDTAGSVRGTVQDADTGAPIADFSVSRGDAPSGGGGRGMVVRFGDDGARSFHSGDGAFELANVPPGRWTLRAEAAGYRPAERSGVEVGAGKTAEGVVLSLKRGGSLVGRVLDGGRGAPVANAQVSWRPAGSGPGFPFDGSGRDAVTDADGRFAFDSLPEGRLAVTASHPDYMEAALEVDPDRQPSVELALGAGASISGTVVASDGRTPAAGARIALDAQGESGRFGGESATADGAGAFAFDHLRAGRYELTAQTNAGSAPPFAVVLTDGQRADGIVLQAAGGALLRGTVSGLPAERLGGLRIFASGSSYSDSTTTDADGGFLLPDVPAGAVRVAASTAAFAQGRTAQTTVEVPENAPEVPVEIVFAGSSRLSGRVTRGEKPLGGLFVVAAPDPPTGSGRASGHTDEDGRYAIDGLDDGPHRLSVYGESVEYARTVEVSGDTAADVAIPAATLAGTVTDAGTGMPLDGADVQAEKGDETQAYAIKRAGTDSGGAYAISDVDPGAYRVTARKTGYRLKTQSVTVGSDGGSLDFALAKGSGLAIRVADGLTGIPLASVQALAFSPDGTVAFQGRIGLDSGGAGEVPSLADGRYAVYLFTDGYSPRSLPAVDVPSPEVSVAMTPGGRVEVRAEAPFTGRLLDGGGGLVLVSSWRLDGSVNASPPVTVWEHLAPGAYRLVAALPGGEKTFSFAVAEGQTTALAVK